MCRRWEDAWSVSTRFMGQNLVLLTFRLVLNKICRNAWALQRMASIKMITRSYSMYLSTGFLHESCEQIALLLINM